MSTTKLRKQAEKFKSELSVIKKYAFATKEGFMPQNPTKTNQDTFIIAPNIEGIHLFAVADGHGQYGHDISGFIK